MKISKSVRHHRSVTANPVACVPLGLVLVMTLAAFVFSGARIGIASSNNAQKESGSSGQGQTYYIPAEEDIAYHAAKQETDARKRAEKLYAFVQKYPKSFLIRRADLDEIKPIVDEYDAYYAALQEPDLEKRATMEIDFLQKFPQSSLKGNIEAAYLKMLGDASQGKRYELVDSLAEKWLKVHPNDKQTFTFIAEANIGLKKYEKAGGYLEALYQTDPSAALAREIVSVYESAGNTEKQAEWTARLFKMPELADDYMLRYGYAMKYYKNNDFQKAADYARLTLKSADLAKPKDEAERKQLEEVRRTCQEVIASELEEKGNYAGAISIYQEAIKDHKDPESYYRIGQILDKQRDVENAMHYYAMTELMGGEDAPKAKDRLEVLYKALHNDTLIGIEKVYRKAKDELAGLESKS